MAGTRHLEPAQHWPPPATENQRLPTSNSVDGQLPTAPRRYPPLTTGEHQPTAQSVYGQPHNISRSRVMINRPEQHI